MVEDNLDYSLGIRRLLESAGHEVQICNHGAATPSAGIRSGCDPLGSRAARDGRLRGRSANARERITRPNEDCRDLGLVTAKTTAFGRVTQRASSDPACFPHSGQASEDSRMTAGEPGFVINGEAFADVWEKAWTAPPPRPQRGLPHVDGPLGGPS